MVEWSILHRFPAARPLDLRTVDLPYMLRLYGVTDEKFDELTDEDTKAELFDGVMIVHSPASIRFTTMSAASSAL